MQPSMLPTPLESPVKEKSFNLPAINKDVKLNLNFKDNKDTLREKDEEPKIPKQSLRINKHSDNSRYKHLELINNIDNISNL